MSEEAGPPPLSIRCACCNRLVFLKGCLTTPKEGTDGNGVGVLDLCAGLGTNGAAFADKGHIVIGAYEVEGNLSKFLHKYRHGKAKISHCLSEGVDQEALSGWNEVVVVVALPCQALSPKGKRPGWIRIEMDELQRYVKGIPDETKHFHFARACWLLLVALLRQLGSVVSSILFENVPQILAANTASTEILTPEEALRQTDALLEKGSTSAQTVRKDAVAFDLLAAELHNLGFQDFTWTTITAAELGMPSKRTRVLAWWSRRLASTCHPGEIFLRSTPTPLRPTLDEMRQVLFSARRDGFVVTMQGDKVAASSRGSFPSFTHGTTESMYWVRRKAVDLPKAASLALGNGRKRRGARRPPEFPTYSPVLPTGQRVRVLFDDIKYEGTITDFVDGNYRIVFDHDQGLLAGGGMQFVNLLWNSTDTIKTRRVAGGSIETRRVAGGIQFYFLAGNMEEVREAAHRYGDDWVGWTPDARILQSTIMATELEQRENSVFLWSLDHSMCSQAVGCGVQVMPEIRPGEWKGLKAYFSDLINR